MIEYDLVIVGGTLAGRYAAMKAARLHARVALVEPSLLPIDNSAFIQIALTQLLKVSQFSSFPSNRINLEEANQWAQEIAATDFERYSPIVLAALGVDVIIGKGEFYRLPHLGLAVGERRMRSRSYFLAPISHPIIPNIEGLQATGYRTSENWHTSPLPRSWVIITNNPIGIKLAQILVRLDSKVTLIVINSQLISKVDGETSFLLQSQLEAEGVRVFTGSKVTQVRQIEDKKWVQAGNQAVEADEILMATQTQLDGELNLEGVGVNFHQGRLELNEKLQTTNPRIYACQDTQIAQYEVNIALKNALFFPYFKITKFLPNTVFCDPQVAWVGLRETEARSRYEKDVEVVRQYFKINSKALLTGETTGFCKFILRGNGEILGAQIVGVEASELIYAIALAMQRKTKLQALAALPTLSPTFSEIITQTASEWQQQRLNRHSWQRDFLESFFKFRRHYS